MISHIIILHVFDTHTLLDKDINHQWLRVVVH